MPAAFSEVRQRLVPVLAGGAVMLMLLTGCQGSDDPSGTETPVEPSPSVTASPTPAASSTASATPEPSPASSLGPAANLPVPVKPALADENTPEGLEAFTEYWFELFSYGYATNDWAPFDAVTDPGCRTCLKYKEVVQEIYSQGRYIEGGDFSVNAFQTDFVLNTQGSVQAFVTNGQSDITFYELNGDLIRTDVAPESVVDVIFAVFTDQGWELLDYGKPEGT